MLRDSVQPGRQLPAFGQRHDEANMATIDR
jgi:hypothetical protein